MLLGTLYPLFLDLADGAKVSVGPPFFNATFVPMILPLFAALCVGPYLGWKRGELWPALTSAARRLRRRGDRGPRRRRRDRRPRHAGGALPRLRRLADRRQPAGIATQRLARANWRLPPRAALGMTIAHAALGVVVLGAVATAAWHLELIQTMKPGESVEFAGYEISLKQVEPLNGPNYVAERATLAVTLRRRRPTPR